ncbi:MAG: hypothetical protein ABSH16_09985 [Sedimentisphaerales bacterium]
MKIRTAATMQSPAMSGLSYRGAFCESSSILGDFVITDDDNN